MKTFLIVALLVAATAVTIDLYLSHRAKKRLAQGGSHPNERRGHRDSTSSDYAAIEARSNATRNFNSGGGPLG